MKTKLFIFLILFSVNVFAVCLSPISRTNINGGNIPTALKINTDFDDLYTRSNTLPGDCIADNSIPEAELAAGIITTAKVADANVTVAKFATGVFPSFGRPLRIRAYTATGSWLKSNDTGSVLVQVIGGGGGAGTSATAGGSSSFGSHCVAGGGGGATSTAGTAGTGGTSSNGDVNLTGNSGIRGSSGGVCYSVVGVDTPCLFPGVGGSSVHPRFGKGGVRYVSQYNATTVWGGGGSGAYCAKIIQRASLSDSETVTIGAGGTSSGVNVISGTSGLVLVYEYAK